MVLCTTVLRFVGGEELSASTPSGWMKLLASCHCLNYVQIIIMMASCLLSGSQLHVHSCKIVMLTVKEEQIRVHQNNGKLLRLEVGLVVIIIRST